MPLLKTTLSNAKKLIEPLDAEILMAHVMELDRLQMLMLRDIEISNAQNDRFHELVERRLKSEPIAYIIGFKEFWGLEFKVTRATLIPRPDSETIIEAALQHYKDKSQHLKILDLGTGTGCLGLTLLHEYKYANATLVDISQDALEVAGYNAKSLGVSDRAQIILSSWFEYLEGKFDIIVCNPPYIGRDEDLMKDVVEFEPHTALFAEDMGLQEYRKIISQAKEFMTDRTMIFFEVGESQAQLVSKELELSGYHVVDVKKDLSGIERVVVAKTNVSQNLF